MENAKQNPLLSVFGAKVSKDGNKLMLVLVSGENDKKRYYNACIKLDNSQKTHAEVIGDTAIIEVVMLNKYNSEDEDDDELPF